MSLNETYIISDIDGTVVPHPYHSGQDQSSRARYVARLETLMKNSHFSCVTGRTFDGWKNLFQDAGLEPHLPRLAGLSFGADTYYHGKLLPKKAPSPEMKLAIRELKDELAKHPEFQKQTDFSGIQKFGLLHGFFIEEKSLITQIDWSFPSEGLNLKFAEVVFQTLNPHLAIQSSLRCQVFHRRIDILSDGFVPKAQLSEYVARWVAETRLESKHPVCYAFGDELYDDYLFASLRSLEHKVFSKVVTIGVQNGSKNVFRNASHVLASPDEVWSFIEGSL